MTGDLHTQLREYGHHFQSKMTPLDVDHIGHRLVALNPEPPKPPRRSRFALAVMAAVLFVAIPLLVIPRQESSPPADATIPPAITTASIPPATTVIRPWGWSSRSGTRLSLIVPTGWWATFDGLVTNGGEPPDRMAVVSFVVSNIYANRCQWGGTRLDPPVGPTVDDLASAFAETWGADATRPADVTLDGFDGKQMVLTVPSDIDIADCDLGRFQSWVDHVGNAGYYYKPGQIENLWILDVDGDRIVISATYFPEASARDQAEIQQIINSIQIETG